ncbi:MAG: hypothetical protein K6F93_07080 [Lachnospiraceae bacterium]|nr:hypothetical protein [Lachnospiraceae bacterium]
MRIKDFGTFGICIDEFDGDLFEGSLYVPVYPDKRLFKSMQGLIVEMNKALETAGVPHPFFEYRSFDEENKDRVEDEENRAGIAAGDGEITRGENAGRNMNGTTLTDHESEQAKKRVYYDHDRYAGKKATFLVNVLYRQNATWQGTVTWVEGEKKMSFRSALELFVLMESAMR